MTGICKFLQQGPIRLYTAYNLIFFSFGLLVACHQSDETGVTVRWQGNRATGLSIPRRLLPPLSADSLNQLLAVRLADKEMAMLGNYQLVGNAILFEPVVPFTRGLRYIVWYKNRQIGEMAIPALATDDKPTLLAMYPSQDSLPDNLLKIYLHFSRPMREGQSLKYIALVKNDTDTLPGVFLDLQPELWNADRTLLTLWLDPGRIKRDLQPNKLLGVPLQTGVHYQVVVSAAWPDEQGATLEKPYAKKFVTIQRDSLPPVPAQWSIRQPKSGSEAPMEVAFGEALDYSLLTETLRVIDKTGNIILGTWQLSHEEKHGLFRPARPWRAGQYRLQVDNRLEDLAGNNVNRPFDRDISRKDTRAASQRFSEVSFSIP